MFLFELGPLAGISGGMVSEQRLQLNHFQDQNEVSWNKTIMFKDARNAYVREYELFSTLELVVWLFEAFPKKW